MTFVAPSFTSDATTLRTPGFSDRVYASIFSGAVVCSGDVIATNANDTADMAISVTGGSIGSVVYGQEVLIFNGNGDLRIRTHVRMAGTISSGNLPIREISYGTAQITSGDTFQVLQEFRLHDQLVGALQTFPPDLKAYTNQGDHPNPQCNSGGHWAGQVDDGQTFATVQMTGSASFIVNPSSNPAHFAHLWTLPSGVAFQSGSADTDADPILEVNQGSYVIQHDYTDSDASVTSTQYVVLMCSDLTHPPYQVFLTSPLQADENYLWHYTVRLFDNATLADIADGALVVLWTREWVNGSWQSFRNATPGRETILAVGYLYADKSTLDAPLNTVTFDVVSPLQRLDEVAGYSKVMEESATPDAWSKIKSLTTSRAMIQLLAYYTTLSLAGFDVLFDATVNDYTYPELYLQRSTPLQQVRELCHGVDARFIADRTGMFNIHTHPKYVPLADRAGITVTFNIAKQDIIHAEFSRAHYGTIELAKMSGFSSGTSPQPLFSLYPGAAPGEAINAPTVDRLICAAGGAGQGDLNERTGRYGADIDQVFIDADGFWNRAFALTLVLPPQYDFFDFYLSYITLTLDGSSNLRGVDLSAFRYWVKSTQITYNGQGHPQLQVVLQAETNAPAGTSYFPPDTTQNYLPTVTVPSLPPMTTLPTVAPIPKWTGQLPINGIVLSGADGLAKLITAFDPVSGAFTYADRSTGITGSAFYWGYSNPFNYFTFYGLSDAGIERLPDQQAGGSWSLLQSITALFGSGKLGHLCGGSHRHNGWGFALSGNNALAVTFNSWASVSQVSINGLTLAPTTSVGTTDQCSLAICGWDTDHLYALAPSPVNADLISLFRSTNGGLNWTQVNTTAWGSRFYSDLGKVQLHIPYIRADGATHNVDDGSLEFTFTYSLNFGGELQTTDGGTNITFVQVANYTRSNDTGGSLVAFTNDSQYWWFTMSSQGGLDIGYIGRSTDNFTTINANLVAFGNGSADNVGVNGWSQNPNAAIGFNRSGNGGAGIAITVDGGGTWIGDQPPGFTNGSCAYAELSLYPFIPGRG